jgi:hypothetical protein
MRIGWCRPARTNGASPCSTSGPIVPRTINIFANGGLAHLLGDLLAFDLDSVNLRQVLRTEALLEQKLRSLNSVESWWYERLSSGTTGRHASQWASEVPTTTLFDDYIAAADKIGVRRKSEETVFGMALKKLIPGGVRIVKRFQMVGDERGHEIEKRVRCYALPPLDRAREHFVSLVGQTISWPSETDDPDSVDQSREGPDYEAWRADRDSLQTLAAVISGQPVHTLGGKPPRYGH